MFHEDGSGSRHRHAHDQEARCGGPLASVARAVEDLIPEDQFRGATAVEIDGFLTTETDEKIREFSEGHADGEPCLPSIDDNEKTVTLIPSERRTRVAFKGTSRRFPGRLAEVDQSRPSTDGGHGRFQRRLGERFEEYRGARAQEIPQGRSRAEDQAIWILWEGMALDPALD